MSKLIVMSAFEVMVHMQLHCGQRLHTVHRLKCGVSVGFMDGYKCESQLGP